MMSYLSTPRANVCIPTPAIQDATSLLALRLESLAMHPEAFTADVDKTAAYGEKVWVDHIREYADTRSGAFNIADTPDELIGMSGIVRGHWPKTRHNGTLWGVYVKPD